VSHWISTSRDRWRATIARRLARSPLGRRYRAAWVLCDRIDAADDNAERLFEYLRSDRPDVNAWYTIDADSAAWSRLRTTHGNRVIARGSFWWRILMLNAHWLISSHADLAVTDPPEVLKLVPARSWKAAFLGHGITQADLSKWLNRRNFDLIVTTTAAETAAFAQDGSPYLYTGREVRATGMPRYDRLVRLGTATAPENRNLVVIAPTWRKWLVVGVGPDGQRREIDAAIWDSEYLASWMGILRSEALRDAAAARRLDIVFFPHPNMSTMLPALDLPPHVEARSYADTDVQELLARTNLMITDYSSVAFDVAVLDRSLVYFQFDRDTFFGGEHIGAAGYFDYEEDGFGPVATTIEDTVQAAIEAMVRGGPDATYLDRIASTFTGRDGRACARATAAIEELSRVHPTSRRDRA
jgi:hypothetical protein